MQQKKKRPKKPEHGGGGTRMRGVIDVVRSGKKGFLIREEADDIEIPREWLGGALCGDVAEVVLSRKYGKQMARVVRVIERKTDTFVGELIKKADGTYLRPDNSRVYFHFRVEGAAGAHLGDKVVATVASWKKTVPTVTVGEVLGVAGDHETEMKAIIAARGFASDFPKTVLDAAQKLYETETPERWSTDPEREDFRSTITFTIDPEDAKDFDDAISFNALPDGNIEVGIHIADVSHFVVPGSAIEKEAYRRATSVYLVDRTIPMLPPQLSEDLCSLKPDVDRLTFSAVFTVNRNNEVVKRRFVRGIIHSDRRFTYEEADALLGGSSDDTDFEKALHTLWAFASALRIARKEDGAIMFDTDEIRPVLDEHKKVVGFKKSVYTESHQLIEELMLLANREVATYVTKRLGKKTRLFVYRIHDKPDADRLDELSVFLRAVGYSLERGKQGVLVKDLNRLLDEIKGTPEEALIKTATIRTMARAVYTTKNIGHFGLSFDYYTHFTSPIRRYPDLMVHQVLGVLVAGKRITLDPDTEEKKALYASEREVMAAEAERASVKLKQVEYFANLIGKERGGVVSGVTDWGIYIADNESGAEGMVRLMTLVDDTYEYDPRKFAVVGAKTGRTIRLGDPIEYIVERVDVDERTIDFRLP